MFRLAFLAYLLVSVERPTIDDLCDLVGRPQPLTSRYIADRRTTRNTGLVLRTRPDIADLKTVLIDRIQFASCSAVSWFVFCLCNDHCDALDP